VQRVSVSTLPLRSSARRKRRRSVNHLPRIRRPQSPFTALDRQRLLVERNLAVRKPLEKRVSQFLELAESRLTWARGQFFQLWDPEWKKRSVKGMDGAAASASRSPQSLVVMDARWWRWNIAFALLPAMLIGTYCEFRGQYMMYKFHQEQELEQARRLMGEEYVEAHRDELIGPPPQNIVTRLLTVLVELKELLLGASTGTRNQDSEPLTVLHSSSAPAPPQSTVIKSSIERPAETSQAAEPLRITETANLEQLQARIEQLEAIVRQKEHIRGSRELSKLNQSGVQNRMEESMLDSWAKSAGIRPAALEDQQDRQDEMKASPHMLTPVMAKISHVLERIVQQARDLASVPPSGSEEKSEVAGLKGGVSEQPSGVNEEQPMNVSHVRDASTVQSNQQGGSTESDVSGRANSHRSWWPWA
jgi:hypothetical protein